MIEYQYYIKKIYQTAPDLIIIEAGDRPGQPVFSFRPGQYAMISYKNKQGLSEDKHAFSIASSPTQNNSICFGIRVQGLFTQGLLNLKEGDELLVSGPHGHFFFDERKYSDLVLIAGGIGITPFYSILNYAVDKHLNNKLALIYSARTSQGAAFYKEIKQLANRNSNISALFSFTEEAGLPKDKNVIYKRLDAQSIKDFVGDIGGKTFFLCGPSSFMDAMIANLYSLGVDKKQIQMEEFSMIPDGKIWPRLRNLLYAVSFALALFILAFSLISQRKAATVVSDNKYSPVVAHTVSPVTTQVSRQNTRQITTRQITPAPIYIPRAPIPRTRVS